MIIFGMVQALNSLHPDAQWAFEEETYEKLEWFSEDIPKPTEAEIVAEIERLTLEAEQAEEERKLAEVAKEEAKSSALAKLAKLGLTEDEVLALIG